MSLRTGGRIARVLELIINPSNLKIEGFYCQDEFDKKKTVILLSQDIRDIIPEGLVVDDHDALTPPDELVRLKSVLEIGFKIIGKPVYTESKQRLGKISDVAIDIDTMLIQKLYVNQSMLKSFTGGGLSIDRSQIVGVSDTRIYVQDSHTRATAALGAPA